jgi:hypothetical protein
MREIRELFGRGAGVTRPLAGPPAPILPAVALLACLSAACGAENQDESLPIVQVGMTCTRADPNVPDSACESNVPPIYDDGEVTIYEVKKGVAFPILAPDEVARGQLNGIPMEPYGRRPWVTTDDIQVQVTWTISNLDEQEHVVELLLDPWNEFGRYYPGLQLVDPDEEKYMPNFSGIDKRYIVSPASGEAPRVHGTFTFSDLSEMATDLATVMGMIKTPPVVAGDPEDMEDPTVTYTNHAFHWQNHSYNDPLVRAWIPPTVAGLTGLDLGFRTYEPANVAIEVAIELVDKNGKRLRRSGDENKPLLPPTDEIITVGVTPP